MLALVLVLELELELVLSVVATQRRVRVKPARRIKPPTQRPPRLCPPRVATTRTFFRPSPEPLPPVRLHQGPHHLPTTWCLFRRRHPRLAPPCLTPPSACRPHRCRLSHGTQRCVRQRCVRPHSPPIIPTSRPQARVRVAEAARPSSLRHARVWRTPRPQHARLHHMGNRRKRRRKSQRKSQHKDQHRHKHRRQPTRRRRRTTIMCRPNRPCSLAPRFPTRQQTWHALSKHVAPPTRWRCRCALPVAHVHCLRPPPHAASMAGGITSAAMTPAIGVCPRHRG